MGHLQLFHLCRALPRPAQWPWCLCSLLVRLCRTSRRLSRCSRSPHVLAHLGQLCALTDRSRARTARSLVQSSGVPVRLEGGTLKASKADLMADILLSDTPAVQNSGDSCNTTGVSLFPELSSIEATWLSVADTGLYSSAPDSIAARRVIAEIGVGCARNDSSLLRDLKLYELDCLPYSSCRESMQAFPLED